MGAVLAYRLTPAATAQLTAAQAGTDREQLQTAIDEATLVPLDDAVLAAARTRLDELATAEEAGRLARRESAGLGNVPPPEEFMCPITHDMMVDPVVALDGHSYERTAIQAVLDSANPRSPLTREVLSRALHPNINLRQRIERHEGDLDGVAAQFEARVQEVAAERAAAAAEAAQLQEEPRRERSRRREEPAEGEEPEAARRVQRRRSS